MYLVQGEAGFQEDLDRIIQVFKAADRVMASLIVSLTPLEHIPIWMEAKVITLEDCEYAKKLVSPPEDASEVETNTGSRQICDH